MRTTLRAIFTCAVFVAFTLTQTSCSFFLGTDITDQKGIDDNVPSAIEKIVGKDTKIIEIEISSSNEDGLSKTIFNATVTYFEPTSNKVVAKVIPLKGGGEPMDWTVWTDYQKPEIKSDDFKKFSEIDFSKIAENVNKGAKLVEGVGGNFSGFGNYTIVAYTDAAKAKETFTIQSSAGSTTSQKGRNLTTETSYIECKYTVDSAGNVTAIEE